MDTSPSTAGKPNSSTPVEKFSPGGDILTLLQHLSRPAGLMESSPAAIRNQCRSNLLENRARSGLWIGRLDNRPSDHQIVGAGADRFAWRRHPSLIVATPRPPPP